MLKTAQKLLLAVILIGSLPLSGCEDPEKKANWEAASPPLLRLHIRAHSNQSDDQAVKLGVRDAVVAYLESELSAVNDFETAKKEVGKRLARIRKISDGVLTDAGFGYRSAATLANEFFPARTYGGLTVESGYYDGLIICLGDGAGDNWWCVIYPPLCYIETAGETDFVYKSKIAEIIKKYFNAQRTTHSAQ